MVKQFSEEEIAKIAFSREPKNMESAEGMKMISQALSKIIPLYDETQRLSEVVARNNAMEIKALITNADTDTLLICFKAFAYHIKKGDNYQMLGSAQKWIMETLKGRNLSAVQNEKPEERIIENKTGEQPKTQKIKPEKVKPEKTKSKSKTGIILGCILLVLILGIGGFFGGKVLKNQKSQGQQDTLIAGNLGDKMVIELYPTVEISDKELEEALKVIDERVKVLGADYAISRDETKITVTIDKNFAEEAKEKEYIVDLISSQGDFDIAVVGTAVVPNCSDKVENVEIATESADKFKRFYCEKMQSYEQENIVSKEDTEIKYLNVTLTGEAALDFKVADETFTTNYFDAQSDTKASFAIIGGGYRAYFTELGKIIPIKDSDYREFVLVQNTNVRSDKSVELLKHIIENDKIACKFETKIIQDTEWETDESEFGENQVAELDEYIEVEYKKVLSSEETEKNEKAVQSFKKKVDFIGVSYSVGYTGLANENLVLRINPADINHDILRLLIGTRSIQIYSQYNMLYTAGDVKINKNAAGELSLQVGVSATKDDILLKYSQNNGGTDSQNIYLVVNDVTIAEAKLQDITDDSKINFSNLICFGLNKISSDEYWLLEMVESLQNDKYEGIMNQCTDITVNYYKNGQFVTDKMSSIPWGYEGARVEDRIVNVVKSNDAEVEKDYAVRNKLVIELDVKTDVNFGENFLKAVEQIYTECNFADGSYAAIEFVHKDAGKENPADIAKMEFSKLSGTMNLNAYFEGPSYEKYQESIKAYAQTSPFYVVY